MAINNYNFKREAELKDDYIKHLQEQHTDLVLSKADEIYLPKILQDPRVIELKRQIKQLKQQEKEQKKADRDIYNSIYDSLYGKILKIKGQGIRYADNKYTSLYQAIASSNLPPRDKKSLKEELDDVIKHLPTQDEVKAERIRTTACEDISEIEQLLKSVSSVQEIDKLSKKSLGLTDKWVKMMVEAQIPKKQKPDLKRKLAILHNGLMKKVNERRKKLESEIQTRQQALVDNAIKELKSMLFTDYKSFGEYRMAINELENTIKSKVDKAFHKQIDKAWRICYNQCFDYFFPQKELEIPISSIKHENVTFSNWLIGIRSKLVITLQETKFKYSLDEPIEKIIDLSQRDGVVRISINPSLLSFSFINKNDINRIISGSTSKKPTIISISWKDIDFSYNKIRIAIPRGGVLWVDASCTQSYNAIKSHLASTLPQIKVMLDENGKYSLAEPIILDNAVQIIRRSADADDLYSTAKADFGKWMCNPTFSAAINFTLSDAHQEYLLRRLHSRKQQYIESLIKKQMRDYKLIPTMESLSHTNSSTSEESFIFTLPCSNPLYVYLVYENLNIARATIVCKVLKQEYQYCLKTLYNHMADESYINKRQELQWHPRKLCNGMISIKSVNHIDSIYHWSRNLY